MTSLKRIFHFFARVASSPVAPIEAPRDRGGRGLGSGGPGSRVLSGLIPVLVLSGFVTAPAAGLQASRPARSRADTASVAATLRSGAVRIDGRLGEPAWRRAEPADGFLQGVPDEGAAPAMPTRVRVLYDAEALYVGARMLERDRGAVADQLVRRDEEGQYDYLEVGLDPNLDGRTGYLFRVGASGVEYDALLSERSVLATTDVSWDAVWESAVRVDSGGWTAEMRIPLSQIRYESSSGPQRWGVNFLRRRLASNSVSHFSLESRTVSGRMSQWGRLTGLVLEGGERRLELRPYVVSEVTARPVDAGNPLADGTSLTPRAGVDVSYGLSSGFTLDATVNPDFGQVEVDPAVVNLTAFETFFPEKRPFFVQDGQLFDFPLAVNPGQLFFSRRIGRRPRGGPPASAGFAELPDRTTILGAGKLTGRTPGGLSVGVLAALTDEETGRATVPGSSETRAFVVEPATEYGTARIRQDLRDGATSLGALVTGVNRHLPTTGRLDHLPSRAFSAGLDFGHRWGGANDRRWSLNGYLAGTRVSGSPEAMLALQTNPQHYFQRPDAERLSVDSTATSMSGRSWRLEFGRQSGEHWTWALSLSEISPGFEPNDLGFNLANEDVTASVRAAYRDVEPGPLLRSWVLSGFWSHSWRHALLEDPFDPERRGRASKEGFLFLSGAFELHNNWRLSLSAGWQPEVLSDTETRGGPLMTDPSDRSLGVELRTDPRRTVSLRPSFSYATQGRDAGRRVVAGMDVSWRPSASWEISLRPEVTRVTDAAQYVATARDPGYRDTFGARYLFADVERTEASVVTRLDVAFSPDLSLQLFAQPLLSAVEFTSTKQLSRPESFEFAAFPEGELVEGTDGAPRCAEGRTCAGEGLRHVDFDGDGVPDFAFPDPDFNLRSMRANAVLRWEFRPGSTLFLVWQHDVNDLAPVGDFDLGRDVDALFRADPTNTLILKASYFLDP